MGVNELTSTDDGLRIPRRINTSHSTLVLIYDFRVFWVVNPMKRAVVNGLSAVRMYFSVKSGMVVSSRWGIAGKKSNPSAEIMAARAASTF